MYLDNGLGLLEPLPQLLIDLTKPLEFVCERMLGVVLASSFFRGQAVQRALLLLLFPQRQIGRIQTFPTQQSTELTRFGAVICLSKDFELVLSVEATPLGLLGNLRIRSPTWW